MTIVHLGKMGRRRRREKKQKMPMNEKVKVKHTCMNTQKYTFIHTVCFAVRKDERKIVCVYVTIKQENQ